MYLLRMLFNSQHQYSSRRRQVCVLSKVQRIENKRRYVRTNSIAYGYSSGRDISPEYLWAIKYTHSQISLVPRSNISPTKYLWVSLSTLHLFFSLKSNDLYFFKFIFNLINFIYRFSINIFNLILYLCIYFDSYIVQLI